MREAGYQQVEAYSPFPVHGINEALERPGTAIPALALIGGVLGAITAYGMEYYCLAIGYPHQRGRAAIQQLAVVHADRCLS